MSADVTYLEDTSNHPNGKTSANATDAFRLGASTRNIFMNRFAAYALANGFIENRTAAARRARMKIRR